MILRVAARSAVPPYEQIRARVATMAATGVLPVGTRLPAIRQLARTSAWPAAPSPGPTGSWRPPA